MQLQSLSKVFRLTYINFIIFLIIYRIDKKAHNLTALPPPAGGALPGNIELSAGGDKRLPKKQKCDETFSAYILANMIVMSNTVKLGNI